jgi:hypothetical protein
VIDDREDVILDEVRELAVEIADEEQPSRGESGTLLTDIASNASAVLSVPASATVSAGSSRGPSYAGPGLASTAAPDPAGRP